MSYFKPTLKNKKSTPILTVSFILHTSPHLPASGIFLGQSDLDFVPQEGSSGCTAGSQEEEGETGCVDGQGTVALQKDLLPPLIVQENGLQLGECADRQEGMENLMPMAHDITGTWEVLLRNRTGEEVGADQKEEDLKGVVPGRLLLATSQVAQGHTVRHRADIQDKGQPCWHHLTDLSHHWVRPPVTVLGIATAGTR